MKEHIEKEIEMQKERIRIEESINKDSCELSFLYYQLHELENELKERVKDENKNYKTIRK